MSPAAPRERECPPCHGHVTWNISSNAGLWGMLRGGNAHERGLGGVLRFYAKIWYILLCFCSFFFVRSDFYSTFAGYSFGVKFDGVSLEYNCRPRWSAKLYFARRTRTIKL